MKTGIVQINYQAAVAINVDVSAPWEDKYILSWDEFISTLGDLRISST